MNESVTSTVYAARRLAEVDRLEIRGLSFQIYRWPGSVTDADRQPLLLLHGWGDTGETWQFLVDALSSQRTVIAYDARGFGRSQWATDGYWFPDYLADLDELLERLSPQTPIDLIGHSMGGNVAMMYAGIRPHRVRRLASLDGVGLSSMASAEAPARYAQWLDDVRSTNSYAIYDDFDHFAKILGRRNPRTAESHLQFIARAWGEQAADGRIHLRADPRHKRVNPVLYQREEVDACWRRIAAPTLLVLGGQSDIGRRVGLEVAPDRLTTLLSDARVETIEAAGHMLHHEQAPALAELIEEFFR